MTFQRTRHTQNYALRVINRNNAPRAAMMMTMMSKMTMVSPRSRRPRPGPPRGSFPCPWPRRTGP